MGSERIPSDTGSTTASASQQEAVRRSRIQREGEQTVEDVSTSLECEQCPGKKGQSAELDEVCEQKNCAETEGGHVKSADEDIKKKRKVQKKNAGDTPTKEGASVDDVKAE